MRKPTIIICREYVNRNDLLKSLRGKRVHAFPQMASKKFILPKTIVL